MNEDPKSPKSRIQTALTALYYTYMATVVSGLLIKVIASIASFASEKIQIDERISAAAKASTDNLLLTFIFYSGLILAIVLTLISLCLAYTHVMRIRSSVRADGQKQKLWDGIKDAISISYDNQKYTHYFEIHAVIRNSFIAVLILTTVYHAIVEHHDHEDSQKRLLYVNQILHFFLLTIYGTTAIMLRLLLLPILERLEAERSPDSVRGDEVQKIFWNASLIDLIFVTAIWATSMTTGSLNHLAFIIPLMSIWLVDERRADTLIISTLLGLLSKISAVGILAVLASKFQMPESVITLVATHSNQSGPIIFELIEHLLFWASISLLVAVLRRSSHTALEKKTDIETELTSKIREVGNVTEYLKEAVAKSVNEELKRRALETLGVCQGEIVFAKDTERRFIFANQVFLEKLALAKERVPEVKSKNAFCVTDGLALWNDVAGKTDEELGIENEIYRASDMQVLNPTSEKDEHYRSFEPDFSEDPSIGGLLWTRKETVKSDGGDPVGLVGSIVPGLPEEMLQMNNLIASNLPIYASMKDAEGHVVWANERHLKKLELKINEILRTQGRRDLESWSVHAKLKHINTRRGPTDADLYGERGREYRERDLQIIERARSFEGTEIAFLDSMEDLVRSQGWSRISKDGRYPESGWIEYHEFPNGEGGKWVEVWKIPWLDEFSASKEFGDRVIGILVVFLDRHRATLRRGVLWRWIENDLRVAIRRTRQATDRVLVARDQPGDIDLVSFSPPRLLVRRIRWFRAFVDGVEKEFRPALQPRKIEDLRTVAEVARLICSVDGYDSVPKINVKVEPSIQASNVEQERLFGVVADDLFVILLELLINAVQATMTHCSEECPDISFRVYTRAADAINYVVFEVSDRAVSQDGFELSRLSEGSTDLNDRGEVPGGLFLAAKLSRHLLSRDLDINGSDMYSIAGLKFIGNSSGRGIVSTFNLPS